MALRTCAKDRRKTEQLIHKQQARTLTVQRLIAMYCNKLKVAFELDSCSRGSIMRDDFSHIGLRQLIKWSYLSADKGLHSRSILHYWTSATWIQLESCHWYARIHLTLLFTSFYKELQWEVRPLKVFWRVDEWMKRLRVFHYSCSLNHLQLGTVGILGARALQVNQGRRNHIPRWCSALPVVAGSPHLWTDDTEGTVKMGIPRGLQYQEKSHIPAILPPLLSLLSITPLTRQSSDHTANRSRSHSECSSSCCSPHSLPQHSHTLDTSSSGWRLSTRKPEGITKVTHIHNLYWESSH